MLKCSNYEVFNFENALRGMRNPLDSWNLNDSSFDGELVIGPNDLKLAKNLRKAGSDHRKYLRQILVGVDIEGPLYWWKEFDTYKVATVANSTSTMHTIHKKGFVGEMFSVEGLSDESREVFLAYLAYMEKLRLDYNDTKDKATWEEIIKLLPTSFNQLRTVTLNYETLLSIYHARKNHKLVEWHSFCKWIEELPYFKEICLED
ncbi:MAG: hypothetical protein GX079_05485 [Tissierellia bacterium]|nr:hypothetical protein [Tissierellia bacterium]